MNVSITNALTKLPCKMCGGERDSYQSYCRKCFAQYAKLRRVQLAREGKRVWTNSTSDRLRANGFHFIGPGWLCQSSVPQVLATISASIVWGLCGRMSDQPEF